MDHGLVSFVFQGHCSHPASYCLLQKFSEIKELDPYWGLVVQSVHGAIVVQIAPYQAPFSACVLAPSLELYVLHPSPSPCSLTFPCSNYVLASAQFAACWNYSLGFTNFLKYIWSNGSISREKIVAQDESASPTSSNGLLLQKHRTNVHMKINCFLLPTSVIEAKLVQPLLHCCKVKLLSHYMPHNIHGLARGCCNL